VEVFEKALDEEYQKQRDTAAQKGYEALKTGHNIELNKKLEKIITIEK
jgi:hypothetical protein